jgi:FkbM family methyltransferase
VVSENEVGVFIKNTTFKAALTTFVAKLLRLAYVLLRKPDGRYVFITPKVLTRQIIYDRKNKQYINLHIRDETDLLTLGQIYLAEDYALHRLARSRAVDACYKAIVERGNIPLIVDCGGNIGLASRYFSDDYDKAKVVCIEPDIANINQAGKNNQSGNVEFLTAAVGSEDGKGDIERAGLSCNAYKISSSDSGETPIVSINSLLARYQGTDCIPFIIKIDIEGFESDLFSKNLEWIESFPLLIIELHDWMLPGSANSGNFLRAISQLDRDFVYLSENVFSISNRLVGR